MFDMKNVGFKISELRKQQNMTQMELADRMGISFQAVSNWERGSSMPDISKLPELAQIFHVTIDEILSEKSGLVESAAKDNLGEYLEDNTVTLKEATDAAPILKPEQINMIFDRVEREMMNSQEMQDVGFGDGLGLMPFLSADTISGLARKAADAGSYKKLFEIALRADCPRHGGGAKKHFGHCAVYLRCGDRRTRVEPVQGGRALFA